MTIHCSTPRFILRNFLPEDAEGVYALDSNPEVMRYLGGVQIEDLEAASKVVEFVQEQYKEHGIGRWAVIEKASGNFVGWCGLKFLTTPVNEMVHCHDLGYRLLPHYWGQGIASECAAACLHHGFELMKLPTIYAAAHLDNIASNKVLQKLGMQFQNVFDYFGAMHNWYKMENPASV